MLTFPHAKINIGLQIVDRRADGRHNLLTVFHPLAWRDALELAPAEHRDKGDHRLHCHGNAVGCEPENNLVMKAIREVDAYVGLPSAVDAHLVKIIPDRAGLGGGSADAAFAIKGLNEMFGLGLQPSEMVSIATALGADCPYFIYGGTMVAEGTGDVMTAAPAGPRLEGWHIVTVKPAVSVSTKEAFAGVTPRGEADRSMVAAVLNDTPDKWRRKVTNDFEPSVFAAHPELANLKDQLYSLGAAFVSLSGSGSAMFALFKDHVPGQLYERLDPTLTGLELFIS